ncbi:MAG: hypothetical protein WBB37_11475 [bacterium]
MIGYLKKFVKAVCLCLILCTNCTTSRSYEITLRNRTDDCIAELHIEDLSITANANQISSDILQEGGDYVYILIAYTLANERVITVRNIISVQQDRTCAVSKNDSIYSYLWEEPGE